MASDDGCADCERTDVPVWYCSGCSGISFCDDCWPRQAAHKAKAVSQGGRPHARENKAKILMIRSILEPPLDLGQMKELHRKDQDSRWFGVIKPDDGSKSQFHDFGRFGQLLLDTRQLGAAERYPKLVSFIGDTYAGKSTIVKALVSHGVLLSKDTSQDTWQSPVPGSRANEGTATSEGVHLYADPEYLEAMIPILYADCEGLNAGERLPFAGEESEESRKATKDTSGPKNAFKKMLPGKSLPIQWTKANDSVRGTRDFAVSNLYPRFLYTFSDAIVFVQRNPNQLHITYKYLVDWAERCIEKSVNQPILPSAIVVLNAVELAGGAERWSTDHATEDFFRDVEGITTSDSDVKELARGFTREGRHVVLSARQLLESYYRSVHVIRIPAKSSDSYNLINTQILQLREEIIQVCKSAHTEKRIKRRMANADELDEYLQEGFIHFANNIDLPFDFRTASARNKLIAQDFGDHILTLARTIQESNQRGCMNPSTLFAGMAYLIASCILLDYVRNNLQDPVIDYFAKDYAPYCKVAFQMFCNDVLPCEYSSKKISNCHNVKSSHDKGHQNENGKREIGEFYSRFDASLNQNEWISNIEQKLKSLEALFTNEIRIKYSSRNHSSKSPNGDQNNTLSTDVIVAVELHERMLEQFLSQVKFTEDFISSVSCFRCLMATPEHPLECGHVLCDSCVREIGQEQDDLVTVISNCPLHRGSRNMNWEIARKPEFAGLRILCSDGGGMRGIVELEILRAIEISINLGQSTPRIPIQKLFDLVVGTSTGGIIALGLVAAQWPVSKCIETFKALCSEAFSERELADTILEKLATLSHGSKWKTKPLHMALHRSLGDDILFGGRSNAAKYATKVAVVSTSGVGNRSLIIANYNRQQSSDPGYSLEIASRFDEAFRIWEAAAATSAAPLYFKPFKRGARTFLDGAVNHNNPVVVAKRERKLLWPDVESRHPDILLSLGTGQHATAIDQDLKQLSAQTRADYLNKDSQAPQKDGKWYSAWGRRIKNSLSILKDKIDNILDTEWAWQEFYRDTVGEQYSTEFGSRYVRINPDLGMPPPPLDAKRELEGLHQKVSNLLRRPPLAREINEIANTLIASCFYFKKDDWNIVNENGAQVFVCRGLHDAQGIKTLAEFLQNQIMGNFVPSFVVKQRLASKQEFKFNLDGKFLDDVHTRKVFEVRDFGEIEVHSREDPVYILLRLRQPNSRPNKVDHCDYPISGFPRRFIVENERNASRQQKKRQEMVRRREASGDSTKAGLLTSPAPSFSRLSVNSRPMVRSGSQDSLIDSPMAVDHEALSDQVWKEHEAWSARD